MKTVTKTGKRPALSLLMSTIALGAATACNLPADQQSLFRRSAICPQNPALSAVHGTTDDTPLQEVLNTLNAEIAAAKPWGAFFVDAAMVRDSIQRVYPQIDPAFRVDFDSILKGKFTSHATFWIDSVDACYDNDAHGVGAAKVFRVRLDVNYAAAEPIVPGQAVGTGYTVAIGHDNVEGPDGNPQPLPFPTPTNTPTAAPSGQPQ